MTTEAPSSIWRGPDGRHWAQIGSEFRDRERFCLLAPAVQDPSTHQWTPNATGQRIEVSPNPLAAGYTELPADPCAEPRLARLYAAVDALVADYSKRTGQPYPDDVELQTALEDVAALAEQLNRRGRSGRAAAARMGYNNARLRRGF